MRASSVGGLAGLVCEESGLPYVVAMGMSC